MNARTVRTLPADVYDALELSAYAFGGIGMGRYSEYELGFARAPVCAIGHAAWLDNDSLRGDVAVALQAAHIAETVNDKAVRRILRGVGGRVSFADWCAALNVR